MSPGKRPAPACIGIEGATQITNPHAAMISPIRTIVFPNGAMAMHPVTPGIVPAGGANRDWGRGTRSHTCPPAAPAPAPSVVAPMKCSGVRVRLGAFLRFLLFLDHLLGDRRRHFVIM